MLMFVVVVVITALYGDGCHGPKDKIFPFKVSCLSHNAETRNL